ncbi:MAG: efflux transporter outer membrane subunit [Gallionellaceae bacterium]|nr:efflux transporter outer membrane subunit [Gallionellaceae bacterium]
MESIPLGHVERLPGDPGTAAASIWNSGRSVRRLAGNAALLIALSGCSLIEPYVRPTPPVAERFENANVAATQESPAVAPIAWNQFFGDPGLCGLLAQAEANNRGLRIAMQRVAEARALYGIQRAEQLPGIGLGAYGSRGRVPADLSITGRSYVAAQYQATLNLSAWELDFWGRVRNLKDAALEAYLASDEARRAVQVALVAQVANTYLAERELDERVAIARRTVATREEAHRILARRYEVGSASRLDAAQAEILLNQARAELTVLARLREQNHNALVLLVGTPLAPAERPLSQVEAGFVRELATGLTSNVLHDRPDVLAAEHRLKAAHANIGAARAAFFPRITLTAGLGSASAELEGLFGSGSQVWSFLPSLSLPIFDAGRTRANLDLAEVRRNAAVADYEQVIQGAFREVADALAERRWLAEQIDVQRASLAAQTERARLADLRYRNGAASYLEVLDAERDRFAAEQALVQTRRALLASAVNLYAALGGGVASSSETKDERR